MMSHSSTKQQTNLAWEVLLPESQPLGWGASRPRATLAIYSDDGNAEFIDLPLNVAKALNSKRKGAPEAYNTRSQLLEQVSDLQKQCAKQRMFSMLSRRDYSMSEVKNKLARDGYPQFAQEHAIGIGKKCSAIDDERFIRQLVCSKKRLGWGVAKIERELKRRLIDIGSVDGWPYDYIDLDEEYDRALAVASRKHVREPHAREKLIRFLVGRGFSLPVAIRASEEIKVSGNI